MRKLAVTAAAVLMLATPAIADDWDFMLTNSSGKTIKTIELAPTGTTTWQPNKIEADFRKDPTIKSGAKTTIHFDKDGKVCKYDIKATFADDTSAVWTAVNVCDNAYVTIKYNAAGAPTFTAS
jgi:hypothetical protein